MAAWTKRTWTERIGTNLNKFLKTGETVTSVILENAPDTITQAGTPFTADAMNNIENGVDSAFKKDYAGEINALTAKTPAAGDVICIEDSGASFAKKKVVVGNASGNVPLSNNTKCEGLVADAADKWNNSVMVATTANYSTIGVSWDLGAGKRISINKDKCPNALDWPVGASNYINLITYGFTGDRIRAVAQDVLTMQTWEANVWATSNTGWRPMHDGEGSTHYIAAPEYNSGSVLDTIDAMARNVSSRVVHFTENCTDNPAAARIFCRVFYLNASYMLIKAYALFTHASWSIIQSNNAWPTDRKWTQLTDANGNAINANSLGGVAAANYALKTDGTAYDLIIDSNAKLAAWAASGTYARVLIKAGTWTLASGGVDLTARGTKEVVGEAGSLLVFSSSDKGLYYTATPTTLDYRMNGVSVSCTGTSVSGNAFAQCINLNNCFAAASTASTGLIIGFYACSHLSNCVAAIVGAPSSPAYGFHTCTNLINCDSGVSGAGVTATGFQSCIQVTLCRGAGVSSIGAGYGFRDCKKCVNNKPLSTITTATYDASYADAGTAAACADTAAGGWNS